MSHRPPSPDRGGGRPQRRPTRRSASAVESSTAGRSFVTQCKALGNRSTSLTFGPNSSDEEWSEGGSSDARRTPAGDGPRAEDDDSAVSRDGDAGAGGDVAKRWASAGRYDSCRTIHLDDDGAAVDEDGSDSSDSSDPSSPEEDGGGGLDDSDNMSVVSSGSSKMWDRVESNYNQWRKDAAQPTRLGSIAESSRAIPARRRRRVRAVAWVVVLMALGASLVYFVAEENFELDLHPGSLWGRLLGNDDDGGRSEEGQGGGADPSSNRVLPQGQGPNPNLDEMMMHHPLERHHMANVSREERVRWREERKRLQLVHEHHKQLQLVHEHHRAREERLRTRERVMQNHAQRERLAAKGVNID